MNKIIIKKIIRKLFPSKKKKKDEIIKEFENSEAPEILLTSNDDKIIVKIKFIFINKIIMELGYKK